MLEAHPGKSQGRIYWSAVGSLANNPEELTDEAVHQLNNATTACPEILARLADDDLPTPRHSKAPISRALPHRHSAALDRQIMRPDGW